MEGIASWLKRGLFRGGFGRGVLCLVLLGALVCACGCSGKPDEFTAEEAEKSLTPADREVIDRVCEKVRAYDAAAKAGEVPEAVEQAFHQAIEDLRDLKGRIAQEGDSRDVNRRMASVSWTMVAATFNRFNGTCASQVAIAAQRGLIDARRVMANPPRGLTTWLLSPGDPRRIEDE